MEYFLTERMMNMVHTLPRIAVAAFLVGSATLTWAQTPVTEPTTARLMPRDIPAPKPGSAEEQVAKRVQERLGQAPESVVRTPFGLYEIIFGTQIVYVDEAVDHLIQGRVIDTQTRTDLTERKRTELSQVDFASLPLKQAIKWVRGKGERVMVTFEDPNCGYCKRLAQTIANMDNVTVYTFLLPILSQDSFQKAQAIWCAKDRAAVWQSHMVKNESLDGASVDCDTPLQSNLAIGQALQITGTPTLVFKDGYRLSGAPQAQALEQLLDQHSAPKKK